MKSTRSEKMKQAIRIGCTAADIHLTCSWPDCSCTELPKAIQAAVAFAVRDVVKEMTADFISAAKGE